MVCTDGRNLDDLVAMVHDVVQLYSEDNHSK
jgi:hypothetical protein